MRVLVTGAAGFLGQVVVDELTSAGTDVTALVHRPTASFRFAPQVTADIGDKEIFRDILAKGSFDGVIHLAALKRGRESHERPLSYFEVNAGGTLHLLTALEDEYKRTGKWARVVFASTSVVYGNPETRDPLTEDRPLDPASPYAASKVACEQMLAFEAARGAIGAVSLRLFNVAGAVGGHSDPDLTRVIPRAVAAAARNGDSFPLNGDGSVVREFVHVRDAARAFRLALEHAREGEHLALNIGSGVGLTMLEVIGAVEQVSGHALSVDQRPPKDEPAFLVADIGRAREELGWEPRHSGIDEIVADAWRAISGERAEIGR